jgi:chromosome segregation ATPase
MSDSAASLHDTSNTSEAGPSETISPEAETVNQKVVLSASEHRMLSEQASAVGQGVADYIRRQVLSESLLGMVGRGAEIAVLEGTVEQLRTKNAALSTHNSDLELRLSATTAEVDALRAADVGECTELRQRIKTLTEHLDSADRHVASMRSRLDQQSSEATRTIARLEGRLREREAEFGAEKKRLSGSIAVETGKLQRRIEEIEEANIRLAAEAKSSSTTAARQRLSLEGRVATLLSDIDELRRRNVEASEDRDRIITSLRRDIESVKSVAAAEKSQLRQALSDIEAMRQREAVQHTKTVEGLKATLAAIERDGQAAREGFSIDRRRFEAQVADERDRARRQLDARDEERRKVEARAVAAEKQAAGATATATMEIARANQLETRLNAERTSRADEIAALQQQNTALGSEVEASRDSANLIIHELRLRLAEAIGEEAAASVASTARDQSDSVFAELRSLRNRVAEFEARQSLAEAGVAAAGAAAEGEAGSEVRSRIDEVMAYARTLESEVAEMRSRLEKSEEATGVSEGDHGEAADPNGPGGSSTWRQNLFGLKVANGGVNGARRMR